MLIAGIHDDDRVDCSNRKESPVSLSEIDEFLHQNKNNPKISSRFGMQVDTRDSLGENVNRERERVSKVPKPWVPRYQ